MRNLKYRTMKRDACWWLPKHPLITQKTAGMKRGFSLLVERSKEKSYLSSKNESEQLWRRDKHGSYDPSTRDKSLFTAVISLLFPYLVSLRPTQLAQQPTGDEHLFLSYNNTVLEQN